MSTKTNKIGPKNTLAGSTMDQLFPNGFETMEITPNEKAEFHEAGKTVRIGKSIGKKMIKEGKAVAAMLIILFLAFASPSFAQIGTVESVFKNTTYSTLTADTVTNGGTGSLTTAKIGGSGISTTIVVTITEISGTTAGTVTILGSVDGTNFKAINTPNTQTAMATATATDVASQNFHWIISGSPFTYYRVQHVGSGTMAARIEARLLKR